MNEIWFLVCEDKTLKVFNTYSEQRGRPLGGRPEAHSEISNLNSGCGKCENYDSKLLSNRKLYSFDI